MVQNRYSSASRDLSLTGGLQADITLEGKIKLLGERILSLLHVTVCGVIFKIFNRF